MSIISVFLIIYIIIVCIFLIIHIHIIRIVNLFSLSFKFVLDYRKIPIGETVREQIKNMFKNNYLISYNVLGTYYGEAKDIEVYLRPFSSICDTESYLINKISRTIEHEYVHHCINEAIGLPKGKNICGVSPRSDGEHLVMKKMELVV